MNSSTVTDTDTNIAIGENALYGGSGGISNIAIGYESCVNRPTSNYNVAVGPQTLHDGASGNLNTAVGYHAMFSPLNYSNSTCLGANSVVTGANQVQLGDAATTTYAYGPVQNRSDVRDKTDIRDTVHGLDFINKLHPVDYKLDMREDYIPPPPGSERLDLADSEVRTAYNQRMEEWKLASNISDISHDGTHTRTRYHHGLIAQEIAQVITETGNDFGGYQDHLIKGGLDVKTLGYNEFIGPIIKAIQQLSSQLTTASDQVTTISGQISDIYSQLSGLEKSS
jgi:hypothetical protein